MTRSVAFWMAAFILVAAAYATGAEPPSTGGAPGILAGDKRLVRRITVSERRLYLGELLDSIREATGAQVEADERLGPVTGYELTVHLSDRPAREVMLALASVYNVPPDLWYWARERAPGGEPRYVLRNTLPPEAAQQAREAFVESFLLEDHQRLSAFFAQPPERRNLLAERDPRLRASNNPRTEGFYSFVKDLSRADLRAIIQGTRREIPAGRLTPEQRAFIVEEYGRASLLGREGVPQPEHLSNLALWYDNEGTIFLELGPTGSHGVLGGIWLDQATRGEAGRSWLARGEDRQAPEAQIPHPEEKAKPEELRIEKDTLDRLLLRIGRLARVNLIFDRPPWTDSRTYSADYPLKGALSGVLDYLGKHWLIWKRREPYLLFRSVDWQKIDRGGLVPWATIRELRQATTANRNYLRPEDWLRLSRLRQEQLEYLGREFPDAGSIQQFQVLLRLVAAMTPRERQAAARPEGAEWADWSDATRHRILVLFTRADARMARVMAQWETDEGVPRVRLFLGVPDARLRPIEIRFRPRRAPDSTTAR